MINSCMGSTPLGAVKVWKDIAHEGTLVDVKAELTGSGWDKDSGTHLVVLQFRIQVVPPAHPVDVHSQLLSHPLHLQAMHTHPRMQDPLHDVLRPHYVHCSKC